jgi:hypothetical protein
MTAKAVSLALSSSSVGLMRAISLTQPWASLIAIGAKTIETRSWPTLYRGPIAIHAAKGFPTWARNECWDEPFRRVLTDAQLVDFGGDANLGHHATARFSRLPLGAIVAVAVLVAIRPTDEVREGISLQEQHFGDYSDDRFAWELREVLPLSRPVSCRGALGLWEMAPEVRRAVQAQTAAGRWSRVLEESPL